MGEEMSTIHSGGNAPFFKVTNLSCGYGKGNFALKGIDLSVGKGEFYGILGRNGSGKSTLFKGICGDIRTFEGSITLGGRSLLDMPAKEKARCIAVVSQFAEVAPITVEEYVLMGRTPYRTKFSFSYSSNDYAIAAKYMNLTGISQLSGKLITEISGGERQMASIASALAQEPQLLLLDEPTSHLDIYYQIKIMDLLQSLNREENLTVVMILHDLNLAGEYCTGLSIMKEGVLKYTGTPVQILTWEKIEDAYGTPVITGENPVSGKPCVYTLSKNTINSSIKP